MEMENLQQSKSQPSPTEETRIPAAIKTRPVQIGPYLVGGKEFAVIAGPCSIESRQQFLQTAMAVKNSGAHMLRGGIYKLRTNPDSFQGMGTNAYDLVKEVKNKTNMLFVSEVTDPRQIEHMMDFVDVFQVGSRNMHNYALLKELGLIDRPILLKRGFSGLISEWLYSAEYIAKNGNENVVLCERGIRTFEVATRNTFDLNAVAFVKRHSHFPVIADPSHATGMSDLVRPMALAAAAAGADGIVVEVHPRPSEALSDGYQALTPTEFQQLMVQLRKILAVLDRPLIETGAPLKDY